MGRRGVDVVAGKFPRPATAPRPFRQPPLEKISGETMKTIAPVLKGANVKPTAHARPGLAASAAAAAVLLLLTSFGGVVQADSSPADPENFVMEVLGTLQGPGCTVSDLPGMVVRSELQGVIQARIGDPTTGGFVAYEADGVLVGTLWAAPCNPSPVSESGETALTHLVDLHFDPIECPLPAPAETPILSIEVTAESITGTGAPTLYTYEADSGLCNPLPDAANSVGVGGTHPERVWIKERYPITSFVSNLDSVPHLVGVDVFPNAENICSISSEVSSTGTQVREREFLLFPAGTEEQLSPLGQVIQLGDQITISTHVVTTSAGGLCDVFLVYTVDAVFWGLHEFSTNVVVPPPVANLGAVAASTGCGAGAATGADNPASVTVLAGTIDVFADLDFAKQCNRHRATGTLLIERQNGDQWVPIGAAITSDTGTARGIGQDEVEEGETYLYRVTGQALTVTVTFSCILAIVSLGITVAMVGTPVGVVAWTVLVLAIAGALAACFGVDAAFSFEVRVTPISADALLAAHVRQAAETANSLLASGPPGP